MSEVNRVNWVICPKCHHRYYVGADVILAKDIPAICPRCRTEFDPEDNLESTFSEATRANKWL